MTNQELIAGHYDLHFNMWVKRLSRRVPGIMDAEDVIQEAYTRALTYAHTFDSRVSSFNTWFTNIVNNVHRDMKRKDFLSCEIREDDWYTKEADDYEDDEFVCAQIQEEIKKIKLAHHRNILFSHFIAGNKVGQTAKQLDIPLEGVKTVVRRFKKNIGEQYGVFR
jgi:RNA polymerase sigma factor (sigma-70 family)